MSLQRHEVLGDAYCKQFDAHDMILLSFTYANYCPWEILFKGHSSNFVAGMVEKSVETYVPPMNNHFKGYESSL